MLTLEEIKNQYDNNFHKFERGLVREYLQYQLLDLIFTHKVGQKLSFLGGTCLRIVYNNKRLSEDLDFDNKNLTPDDFNNLVGYLEKELQRLGFSTETRIVHQNAFRCYLKLPELLYQYGLSPLKNEKILIQLDSFNQGVNYPTELHIINKFDILKQIIITPKDVILAQKLWTITQRKRAKGRDFYDIIFLLKNTKPNIEFLKSKFGTSDKTEIKEILLSKIEKLDWKKIVEDVKPFLIDQKETEKIKLFPQLLKQTEL